ncbi:alpha/beta hydrolase [soil metagenome]
MPGPQRSLRQLAVGPLTFDVLEAGPADGPVVVLLHGFPQDGRAWGAQVPDLAAAGVRVLAPSQRGYSPGASPTAVRDYAMPQLVGDVVGVLDAIGAEDAHVVGHDWGGSVAWQMAARHPDRVRTLTVLSTPHPVALGRALQRSRAAQLRFSYALLLRLGGSERVLGAADGWLVRRLGRLTGLPAGEPLVTDPATLRTALHWYRAFSESALKDLPRITVPTLYISGSKDPVFTDEAAVASREYCDGPYTHLVLPDAGHWPAQTHPHAVNTALLAHLHP